jgi:hypothetical protein
MCCRWHAEIFKRRSGPFRPAQSAPSRDRIGKTRSQAVSGDKSDLVGPESAHSGPHLADRAQIAILPILRVVPGLSTSLLGTCILESDPQSEARFCVPLKLCYSASSHVLHDSIDKACCEPTAVDKGCSQQAPCIGLLSTCSPIDTDFLL